MNDTLIAIVLGFLIGAIATIGFELSLNAYRAVEHGCAGYVCDETTGSCEFTWRDEMGARDE